MLEAWAIERRETSDLGFTLFGVVNAITRAGQGLDDSGWLRFDRLGGEIATLSRNDWEALVLSARGLRPREVEARFAPWSVAA